MTDHSVTPTIPTPDPRFNINAAQWKAIGAGWLKLKDDNCLEVVSSEGKVINDPMHLAGSYDRHCRATRPLSYMIGDKHLDVAAGDVVTVDIKTSKSWMNETTEYPPYWETYPLQILAYNEGRPYDVHTDLRGEWGYQLNQQVAFIAHFDVDELLENNRAVWQLIAIDLDVARQGVEAVEAVRAYKATPKFAMPNTLTSLDATAIVEVDPMGALKARYAAMDPDVQLAFSKLGVDMSDVAAVKAGLDSVDPFMQSAELVAREPLAPVQVKAPAPDEGEHMDTVRWTDKYDALDEAQKQWIGTIVTGANRNGTPIDPAEMQSQRRVFAVGALVVFASHFIHADDRRGARQDADDLLVTCLDGPSGLGDLGIPTLVGSLDAAAAITFAQTVTALTSTPPRLQPIIDNNGRWILTQPTAA